MKKIRYLLVAMVAATILIGSCKKPASEGNPLNAVSNLALGAYLVQDSVLNLNLNFAALATSTVGITVDQFPDGQAVKTIDLYVSAKATYDPTQWKHIKTISYAGSKTAVTCTGQDLATALGVSLSSFSPGSSYNFYTRVTTASGQTFDVSNTGNDAGTGFITGSTYKAAFSFVAYITCPFMGPVGGSYRVVRDDWVDWNPGDVVQVTDAGTNSISLAQVYPGAPDGGVSSGNLVVNIDPATGTASVPKQVVGTYGGSTQYSVVGSGGADNGALGIACGYVFSCTGYIIVTLDWAAVGGSDYGPNTLILQYIPPSAP